MNPFEMVVLIVLISVAGKFLIERSKARRRERPDVKLENERLRAELGGLKQRIATLERIATDRSRRLSDEIDGLGRDR